MGYNYYDTPDGKDCFKKILFTTKWSTMAGLVTSIYDVLMVSHPKGAFNTVARVAYWAGPFAMMGATFGAVTCAATTIRKKDDAWNYAIGGACAGATWGAARGKLSIGIGWTVTAMIVGVITKNQQLHDWDQFQGKNNQKEFGTYNHYKRDFTMRVDPGRTH